MKVELFPFQKRALADIRMKTAEAMGSYHRTHAPQVVSFTAPTGAGKTIIMASLIESIFFGDENYAEQPNAIIVWLSDSPQLNEQAMEMLEAVGLADRANHKPFEMSGGQQQRVSIARAFVNRPPVVFADEPTGNLDTKTTYEMMDLITGMAQKNHQTLVIVTHDQELAEYADRIVVLQDGKIEKIQKRIREKKENVYE